MRERTPLARNAVGAARCRNGPPQCTAQRQVWGHIRDTGMGQRGQLSCRITGHTRETSEGGLGGVWDPKVCVPKMA